MFFFGSSGPTLHLSSTPGREVSQASEAGVGMVGTAISVPTASPFFLPYPSVDIIRDPPFPGPQSQRPGWNSVAADAPQHRGTCSNGAPGAWGRTGPLGEPQDLRQRVTGAHRAHSEGTTVDACGEGEPREPSRRGGQEGPRQQAQSPHTSQRKASDNWGFTFQGLRASSVLAISN